MTFELRVKYDWYFKYRAALYQVQNPKARVEVLWGSEPATGKTLFTILINKSIVKRAKITGLKDKINRAVTGWNELFPIEDEPRYQAALLKLAKLELELFELQAEIESLTTKN